MLHKPTSGRELAAGSGNATQERRYKQLNVYKRI